MCSRPPRSGPCLRLRCSTSVARVLKNAAMSQLANEISRRWDYAKMHLYPDAPLCSKGPLHPLYFPQIGSIAGIAPSFVRRPPHDLSRGNSPCGSFARRLRRPSMVTSTTAQILFLWSDERYRLHTSRSGAPEAISFAVAEILAHAAEIPSKKCLGCVAAPRADDPDPSSIVRSTNALTQNTAAAV